MPSVSEERLRSLWLKAMAACDPAETESLLFQFRDVLHEYIDQRKAETNDAVASWGTSVATR